MSGKVWQITIYNNGEDTALDQIPIAHITDSKVISLIRTLCAKIALTNEEIVREHLRKNTKNSRATIRLSATLSSDPISYMAYVGSVSVQAIIGERKSEK